MKHKTIYQLFGMKLKAFICALFVVITAQAHAQQEVSIVPQPQKYIPTKGTFILSANTKISSPSNIIFIAAIKELNALKADRLGVKMMNLVVFKKDPSLKAEGYHLNITPKQITISANDKLGAFWAISTLKQMAGTNAFAVKKALVIPSAEITDYPKFTWRGYHLDVSRHFFDIDYLKKVIDRMALYKFNKFHWHLTDDQGWRIEIKKYPELTRVGAWRKLNNQDSACLKLAETNPDYKLPEKYFKTINGERMYGGFYTQEQIKAFIKYADSKGIEVIPEIDMPGHMQAATKPYPWLTSTGEIRTGKNFTDPICPCKETTFEFAQHVFKEVASLFPSKYIHLGADEVEKSSWKDIPACEDLMKREGLKSIDEIQSYFVKRMEKFFNGMGKKLIGWDEILDGGVSPTATLMYWRTWVTTAPKHAAEKGNDLIMTPGEFCYFDAKQDANSLKKVYSFNPVGFGLNKQEQKFVLGGQANTWTEYIPSEKRVDYMVYPRLLAMAEVLWGTNTSFDKFYQKMDAQYELLEAQNINYRFPDLKGFSEKSVFVKEAYLKLVAPKGTQLRYTDDGTSPTANSKRYTQALLINRKQTIKVAILSKNGRLGEVSTINYEPSEYLAPTVLNDAKPGLDFTYYPKFYKEVSLINEADKSFSAQSKSIEIPVADKAASFATKHKGYFFAAEDGIYTFYLLSDDGSVLKMHNKTLVDNDGMHAAFEKSAQIALKKGYHPFELLFLEGGGGYTLQLEYSINGGERKAVSPVDFFRP